jgi:signal transduction histidine kinase/CheY-like chemotaxis protein
VHGLLAASPADQPGLSGLLGQLAETFEAASAGLADLPGGNIVARFPAASPTAAPTGLPWQPTSEQLASLRQGHAELVVPREDGGSRLLTALSDHEGRAWLLWLEAQHLEWSDAERAALFLAGQVLLRCLTEPSARPRWAQQVERRQRQQRMDHAAAIVRRLAHDFGNVLTGILGFAELALAQPQQAGAPLHGYLTEVHRSAQAGAQLTQQLRQLGRRAATGSGSCGLAAIVAEESKRLRSNLDNPVRVEVSVPRDLPLVSMSAEPLRQVLAVLLDNAREAIPAAPSLLVRSSSMPIIPSRVLNNEIKVSAQPLAVSDDLAADFYGDVRPGPHVEITITDTGCGLSEEGWQRLFHEPFYSTKPRRRGFGLAIAYSLLSSNRSGLQLAPGARGGTTVRILVPALPPAPAAPVGGTASGGRILVVDDDQMILQFVSTTLKRAGFQVHAAASADEALKAYTSPPGGEAFQLVLADVLMPNVGGIDLARQLLAVDPAVHVLFMSGQATQDIAQSEIDGQRFDMLSKPFRPEGLLRAVRSALEAAPSPA